jgi:hypothetical protein
VSSRLGSSTTREKKEDKMSGEKRRAMTGQRRERREKRGKRGEGRRERAYKLGMRDIRCISSMSSGLNLPMRKSEA